MPIEKRLALKAQFPDAEHPVVRTHPETGEKVLFVNAFTTHFTNFHTADERALRPGLRARRAPAAAVPDQPGLRSPSTRCAGAGSRTAWRCGTTASTQHYAVMDYPPCHRKMERAGIIGDKPLLITVPAHSNPNPIKDTTMNFLDGSLFPENQEKLVITAAPYGPEWMPSDFPEDIPVTMEEQIQKAVDCYNAGATVLHLHVRELDGKGSKRLSKFNELIAGRAHGRARHDHPGRRLDLLRARGDGDAAKWLSDDTRHMLAELSPKPDQVTVAINTNQMNVVEQMCAADVAGTSLAEPPRAIAAYREMTIPAGPGWVEEHIRRLSANGIQSALPVRQHHPARDGRAHDAPRRLQRAR